MSRVLRWLVGVSVFLAGIPTSSANAQAVCNGGTSCSLIVTLQLGRPEAYSLVLNASTTVLPTLTAADFSLGRKDASGPTVTIKANAPYRITVAAAQATWQFAGGNTNPAKPASDLLWSRTAGGPFVSSAVAQTLWPSGGTSAPPTAGQTVTLFYRTQWQWTTSPPGTYTLPVNITLTSP